MSHFLWSEHLSSFVIFFIILWNLQITKKSQISMWCFKKNLFQDLASLGTPSLLLHLGLLFLRGGGVVGTFSNLSISKISCFEFKKRNTYISLFNSKLHKFKPSTSKKFPISTSSFKLHYQTTSSLADLGPAKPSFFYHSYQNEIV